MKIKITSRFKKSFQRLTEEERKAFQKQIRLLLQNPFPPFHPSLRIKKIQGTSNLFECSITRDIRMTWQYHQSEFILLRNIGKHDRTLKKP
jgi:mRNA-degrading endonuclease YafQ of YafQ-DinJ toxin-antitoxin module